MLKPAKLPKGAKAAKSLVLIKSQATSNTHAVSGGAKVYAHEGRLFVKSRTKFKLVHSDPKEGHKPLTIPAGEYVFDQPNEYDHFSEEARAVAD